MKKINFFFLLFTLLSSILVADIYKDPAPDLFKIKGTDLTLTKEEKTEIATVLAESCRNFRKLNNSSLNYIYRTLSLASLLDPDNRAVIISHTLAEKGTVKPLKKLIPLSETCLKYSKKMLQSGKPSDVKIAGFLLNTAYTWTPDDEDLIYEHGLFEKKHMPISWDLLYEQKIIQKEITRGVHPYYKDRVKKTTKNISGVNVLVVRQNLDGSSKGSIIELIANVKNYGKGNASWTIKNGSQIGSQMQISINEAFRVLLSRYPVVQAGVKIELSFSDKYSPKDGGSMGTATALLLLSLYDDFKIDNNVALTGDITIDWKTRKVGGVVEKIIGAIDADTKIIIIPNSNKANVKDLVVLHSAKKLLTSCIFTAESLDEVVKLARVNKSTEIKEAISRLSELQKTIKTSFNKADKGEYIKELDEILNLTPNNMTAKILKDVLGGKSPKTLTIMKSTEEILHIIGNVEKSMPARAITRMNSYTTNELLNAKKHMKKLAPKLDKKTHKVLKKCIAIIDSSVSYQRYNRKVFNKRNKGLKNVSQQKTLMQLHAKHVKNIQLFQKDFQELLKQLD